MWEQVVRVGVRLAAGAMMGAVPGALYAGLVGSVHFGLYGRWDRVPAFAVGCVLVGALLGLLGSTKSADAWANKIVSTKAQCASRAFDPIRQ